MQRSRSQYWLLLHVKELSELDPLIEFDCMTLGSSIVKEEDNSSTTSEEHSLQNVMVFQLGSFKTYKLYVPPEIVLKKGVAQSIVKERLLRRRRGRPEERMRFRFERNTKQE